MRCRPTSSEPGRKKFRIYVLELDPETLYVGSTAKALSERLREHRNERWRGKYRRDLSPGTLCATRERAEQVERKTAERLRRRGWDVVQG